MVKGCSTPTIGVVAGTTIHPELAVVLIIFLVTGKAVRRRSLEHPIGVAGSTGDVLVPAVQFESCPVVIKCYILPTAGTVAGSAFLPELAIVNVIPCMTGETIPRRASINSVRMTTLAVDLGMLPC